MPFWSWHRDIPVTQQQRGDGQRASPPLGVGSGVLATIRNVGMVLGIAVASGVFTWQRAAKLAVLGPEGTVAAFMAGLKGAFLVGAGLAATGALASLVRLAFFWG